MDSQNKDIRGFRKSLRLLEREIGFSLSEETECCGVSLAQCHLLLESEGKEGAGISELASSLDLDKSTLSRTVESMRKAGYLSREIDPENRRQAIVRLTPSGKEKAGEINGLCDDSYAKILEKIPEEKRSRVVESVALLAHAMRDYRRECESREGAAGCCGPGKEK